MTEILYKSLSEWFDAIETRVNLGHTLLSQDNAYTRQLGFKDETSDELLEINLTTIRTTKNGIEKPLLDLLQDYNTRNQIPAYLSVSKSHDSA